MNSTVYYGLKKTKNKRGSCIYYIQKLKYKKAKFKGIEGLKVKRPFYSIYQVKPNDSSNECSEVGVLFLRLLVTSAKASS